MNYKSKEKVPFVPPLTYNLAIAGEGLGCARRYYVIFFNCGDQFMAVHWLGLN
jgi:hypothetical protein